MFIDKKEGLCKCGCGNKTKLAPRTVNDYGWKRGFPLKFIMGHQRKGIKLTKEHKEKLKIAKLNKRSNHWKGGIFVKDGYKFIYNPLHPFANKSGYIREHRLIMEKKIGRYLKPEERIHHKNEITIDNRPENLEIVSLSQHPSLHNIGRIKISQNALKEAINLKKQNWTFKELGKKFNVDRKTMKRYLCQL